jgi:uncharacterized membrane protein YagU involved in acid resistance
MSSWPKAVLAGIAATAVETLMMYKGATMMIGQPMDIALELSNMMGVSWTVGMIMHVQLGIVIFPLAYASVMRQWLPGPNVARGILWGLVLWVVAMFVMSPMMGKGLFIGGMPQGVAALLAHVVYGAILGAIVGNGATRA